MTAAFLAISALGAGLYGTVLLGAPKTLPRAAVKTTAVAALAAYAFAVGAPVLLVGALAFSALGDLLLALEGDSRFLAGLASFLVAHLLLIVLFRSVGLPLGEIVATPWRFAGAVAMVGLCGAMLAWLWRDLGGMRLPVVAYTAAIAAMVVSATALDGRPSAIVGAFAFAVSDSCLAVLTFRPKPGPVAAAVLPPAVWWLYWGAQVAILAGFVRLGG